jgi:glycosyltransferase involved in cell wall biosynthesis
MVLAMKGAYLYAATIRELRVNGIAVYNYFPDPSPYWYGELLPQAMPEYDAVFTTKSCWDDALARRLGTKNMIYLAHGYDPEIHRPWPLNALDRQQFEHDVVFVGTHTPWKEQVLAELRAARPNLELWIAGNGWLQNCRSPRLSGCIFGPMLTGNLYAKALQAGRISLAIMGWAPGTPFGDKTTTRTYEIPACGGFMIHERNHEVLGLFREGFEIECFDSTQELAEKIDYYLAHPKEREGIARAAHERCVPAYSYDSRMLAILQYHQSRTKRDGTVAANAASRARLGSVLS